MNTYFKNAFTLKALLLNILGMLHRTAVNFISSEDAGEVVLWRPTLLSHHQPWIIVFAVGGCIWLIRWHQRASVLASFPFCRTRWSTQTLFHVLFPLTLKKCAWLNDNRATEQMVGTSSAFLGRDCPPRAPVFGGFLGTVVREIPGVLW